MSRKRYGQLNGDAITRQLQSPAGGVHLETFLPWSLVRRRVRTQVIAPDGSPMARVSPVTVRPKDSEEDQVTPLLKALGLAHHWQRLLDEGRYQSMTEIAAAEGIDLAQASRLIRLVQLSPELITMMTAAPSTISLNMLLRGRIPNSWEMQGKILAKAI